MSITARVGPLFALFAASVFVVPLAVTLVLLGALVVVAVLDAWTVRAAPSGSRVIGAAARGLPTPMRIRVTGPTSASRIEVRQPIPPDTLVIGSADITTRGNNVDHQCSLVFRRRGDQPLLGVAVRATGPLRLGRWQHTLGEPIAVTVQPDLPNAQRLVALVRRGSLRSTGVRRRGPLGLGTEFESVREYLPDDDVRQINWRATARQGTPMSNSFRVEHDRDVWCLVDAGRLMMSPFRSLPVDGGDPLDVVRSQRAMDAEKIELVTNEQRVPAPWTSATRLDASLDAVSALALVADDRGDRCGCISYDAAVIRSLAPSRHSGVGVIDAIRDLEARPFDADHERAARTLRASRRSLVMLFTDVIDPASVASLVSAVQLLAQRHDVAIVIAVDPELALRTQSADRVLRASGIHAQTALLAATELLVRAGARIVSAPPALLAEATIRAYLDARANAFVSGGLSVGNRPLQATSIQ